jgi:hypothetical protein
LKAVEEENRSLNGAKMVENKPSGKWWRAKSQLVCSRIYPGTVQQFRAQMQRLFRFSAIQWGREVILEGVDPRIKGGLWKSSEGLVLLFEEVRERQYPPGAEDEPTLIPASEMEEYTDITPSTRSTWAVYHFQRRIRVTDPAEAPDSYQRVASVHLSGNDCAYEYQERGGGFAGIEAYELHNGTLIDFLDGYDPVRLMDLNMPAVALPIGYPFEEFSEWVISQLWAEGDNESKEPLREKRHRDRLIGIRLILTEHFDDEELRTLCFDLGVDYDDLPGRGRTGKARELVSYLSRHKRIESLIEFIRQNRKDIVLSGVLQEGS